MIENDDPRESGNHERPHPLDGGVVHGHRVPEHLTQEQWLKQLAASEEHVEVDRLRGYPPRGKL